MTLVDPLGRPLTSRDTDVARWREAFEAEQLTTAYLEESIGELESSLHDLHREGAGWALLSGGAGFEFSFDALMRIVRLSRLSYLKNPLIQRATNVSSFYTFGRSCLISAREDQANEVLDAFRADRGNREELFDHKSQLAMDVQLTVDGNLFLPLFTSPVTGRVKVRWFPPEEIPEYVRHPDDGHRIIFWKRTWTAETLDPSSGVTRAEARSAWHPDWTYWPARPSGRLESIGGQPVRWDAPVMHVKTGGLKGMVYGVPETYAALDWARAHKQALEDWSTVVASLAKFAWTQQTKRNRLASAAAKLHSTVASQDGRESNPPPIPGSVFVHDESAGPLLPIPKTGAHVTADDFRHLRLMVAAAMNLSDPVLSGDAAMGNHATQKALSRPEELAFMSRQQLWADVYRDLCGYVLDWAARATNGPLPTPTVTYDDDEAIVTHGFDANVDVTFPPILEPDLGERVRAIISAATLDGKTPAGTMPGDLLVRLLVTELGVEGVDEVVAQVGQLADKAGQAQEAFAEVMQAIESRVSVLEAV